MDPVRKSPRSWRCKFRDAFRGIKRGVRGHSSFYVHFFFAVLAIVAGLVLPDCKPIEWCLIAGCIGAVFVAELFNSALETLFHGLDEETKGRIKGSLDIAAGAVLVVALTAVVIGLLIFVPKLRVLLGATSG